MRGGEAGEDVAALLPQRPTGDGFCEACFTGDYPVDVIPAERLSRGPSAPSPELR